MKDIRQYFGIIFILLGTFVMIYEVFIIIPSCGGFFEEWCFPNVTVSIMLLGLFLIIGGAFLVRKRIGKMILVRKFRLLLSLFLGLLTTVISAIFSLNKGDFILSGLPIPYHNAVWGEGYVRRIIPLFFIIDILAWSIVWFVIFSIIARRIRKKEINEINL